VGAATGELLERERALSALEEALVATQRGEGRLVLVGGDAGIGKTALVRAFCSRHVAGARVLVGACDGLRTPRPLAPLADIARLAGGRLQRALADYESAPSVFDAFLEELRTGPGTIAVFEDIHWADEATLDILGMLGRRVEGLGVLVIATYRTDELPRTHPLRVVLGDLATAAGVFRLQLEPLSPAAVAELAASYGIEPGNLHARTGGNPFFVTEVLAGGPGGSADLAPTVRDAVLARVTRLGPAARRLLDAIAVVPQPIEVWLFEAIAGDTAGALDECLTSGMLRSGDRTLAFRHELARLAIEQSINPQRHAALHRAALEALRTPPDGRRDLARLAHHAEAAGDAEAVLEFAPAAAERASAVGAHREAAAQYARALRCAGGLPEAERAGLLERRSFECYLTSQEADAIATLEEAIDLYRAIGDIRGKGLALIALGRRRWCASDTAGAEEADAEAISVLEELGPGPELARAYAGASSTAMNLEKAEPAFAWGKRALQLIDEERELETLVFQLNNTGTMSLLLGRPEGRDDLERSIALAAAAGLDDQVGRGYIHLGWVASRTRDFAAIERLADGIEFCAEHGLELWRLYLIAYRARAELDQGRWTQAAEAASFVLGYPHGTPHLRILALSTLALIRARRGDPDVATPLDEARALAAGKDDLQHLAPVAIARTELAALAAKPDAAGEASEATLELALDRDAAWVAGELAFWRRRAGIDEALPAGLAGPFAAHLRGDWAAARAQWRQLGCPYEAAFALADAAEAESLRTALAEFHELGAAPAAAVVTRSLRRLGERRLARGPRPATRENPAGLTRRELEVLALVSEGLHNGEIAARLFLSRRTIDHHVSAILRKLSVETRAQASSEAVRFGLTGRSS
jgi:DNA-binding CsgD family transcriptional regulator